MSAVKLGFATLGNEGQDMAVLLTAGSDHAEHALDKTAARGTVSTAAAFAPLHRVPQGPLR